MQRGFGGSSGFSRVEIKRNPVATAPGSDKSLHDGSLFAEKGVADVENVGIVAGIDLTDIHIRNVEVSIAEADGAFSCETVHDAAAKIADKVVGQAFRNGDGFVGEDK